MEHQQPHMRTLAVHISIGHSSELFPTAVAILRRWTSRVEMGPLLPAGSFLAGPCHLLLGGFEEHQQPR